MISSTTFASPGDKPTVGIVGLRNHAQRLREALEPIARVTRLYHPHRSIDDSRCTQVLEDLWDCDAIVIASPDDTHHEYLMRLLSYPGYILCEKPAGGIPRDLESIERHVDLDRFLINLPFRHTRLANVLRDSIFDGNLGTLLSFSATVSHGLAFRPSYQDSWRSRPDIEGRKTGIIRTMGIHMIDLMLLSFRSQDQRISTVDHRSHLASGVGEAYDTSRILATFDSGATGTVLVSCAAPFVLEVDVLGTEGRFQARDGRLRVTGPRDTFDDRGFSVTPPVLLDYPNDPEADYDNAVRSAMAEFVGLVARKQPVPRLQLDSALNACWAVAGMW